MSASGKSLGIPKGLDRVRQEAVGFSGRCSQKRTSGFPPQADCHIASSGPDDHRPHAAP